jgi:hypothetical protein
MHRMSYATITYSTYQTFDLHTFLLTYKRWNPAPTIVQYCGSEHFGLIVMRSPSRHRDHPLQAMLNTEYCRLGGSHRQLMSVLSVIIEPFAASTLSLVTTRMAVVHYATKVHHAICT